MSKDDPRARIPLGAMHTLRQAHQKMLQGLDGYDSHCAKCGKEYKNVNWKAKHEEKCKATKKKRARPMFTCRKNGGCGSTCFSRQRMIEHEAHCTGECVVIDETVPLQEDGGTDKNPDIGAAGDVDLLKHPTAFDIAESRGHKQIVEILRACD